MNDLNYINSCQIGFLNFYIMLQVETDEKHWIWLAGDAVVLLLFSITFYLREWRIDNLTSRRKEQTGFDKGTDQKTPKVKCSHYVIFIIVGIFN